MTGIFLLVGSPGFAVSDEDIYNQLNFNFINPGGRALGMGGASIAAVQDSTASLSNPAALVMLVNDEFFAEFRSTSFNDKDSSFDLGSIDVQAGTFNRDVASPTYVSYVHQWTVQGQRKVKGNPKNVLEQWAIAFSRQEVANIDRTVVDQELRFDDPSGNGRFFSTQADGEVDLEVVQYNVGLAGQINRNWSIGVTGTYAEMDLSSKGLSLTDDPFNIFNTANPREVLDPETLTFSTVVDNKGDDDITGSFGLFWQPNSYYGDAIAPLRLGLTFNLGPKFEVPITVLDKDMVPFDEGRSFVLKVPDRYGVGFAYEILSGPQEQNRVTFALDTVWVKYQDLLEGFENGLNTFTRDGREIAGQEPRAEFTIDDGIELRAGFEWSRFLGQNWNLDLRAGYARLPANVIFADRVLDKSGAPLDADLEAGLKGLYAEGEDQNAFSAGISLAFVGEGLKTVADLAYQFGDDVDQAVVSVIIRF